MGLARSPNDQGGTAIPTDAPAHAIGGTGRRLVLRPFPTLAVPRLAERVQDVVVAPWPRVYADLRPLGVRGEEAAEHLAEVNHVD